MARQIQPTGRALIASFTAVAIAFTLGIAVAQIFSIRIRSAAREITHNASPSVSSLSSMRSAIRELEVLADDFVDQCFRAPCPVPPPRVDELRRALRLRWAEYRALPTFPGETQGWPAVDAALVDLDERLALMLAALAGGRHGEAEAILSGGVKPASDRLDAAVAERVQFDHDQGLVVASRIDAYARLSLAASVLLDLVSIALTVVAATLGIRVVRRYERSLRERADELDQFAGRVAHDVRSPLASAALALQVARREANDRGRVAIARGESALRRVELLVEGLLEFARAGAAASPRSTAVQGVLEGVVDELRPVADENRVVLRVDPASSGNVACSPGVLTSVVGNLVRNAIVHMGDSAVREVRIRTQPAAAAGQLRIEVEDTGPGMPRALGTGSSSRSCAAPGRTDPGAVSGSPPPGGWSSPTGARSGSSLRAGRGRCSGWSCRGLRPRPMRAADGAAHLCRASRGAGA